MARKDVSELRKVVVVLSFCLAIVIWMSASGACAASGLSLELRYWVPSVDGADEVAWHRILYEQYADWSSEPQVDWEHETWTPYTLSPGKAGTYVIRGTLGLTPLSSVCFSYWGISASGSVGSPTVPVEYSYESQYDPESQSSYTYQDNRLWMWGNTWDLSVDQYYPGDGLANDYEYHLYGDMSLAASSTDLLYERQALVSPAGQLVVVAGLRHAALSREEAAHFECYYEHYPHPFQGYPEGSYYSDRGHECVESRASFSLLGPEVGVSADAALLGNIRLSGRLAYSVLFGKAHLFGRHTSEWERKYYGGYTDDDYEGSYSEDVERSVGASVPVLDAEIGLCCSLSDSIEVFAGYMASTWLNVPEPPSHNASDEAWDLAARGAVSFRGFTVGATVRF